MRATRPQTPRQVRVTCTPANRVCRLYKIAWCRCIASAAIQLRKLVVRSTKSPAGAVQPAQWRELEVSSSRAPAEFFDVMRNARRLSHLWCSSVSGGTADGEKTMRAARPQTPRQVKVTCTPANQFAVIIKIVWCRCVASAAIQLRKLVVRSTKSPAGAVQPAQWRELEVSSSRAPAEFFDVMRNARRLSHLWCSSVSGGTADGEKTMRAARPQTPRQVKVTCTPANQFAVIIKIVWCRCVASAAIQLRKLVVRSTKSPA